MWRRLRSAPAATRAPNRPAVPGVPWCAKTGTPSSGPSRTTSSSRPSATATCRAVPVSAPTWGMYPNRRPVRPSSIRTSSRAKKEARRSGPPGPTCGQTAADSSLALERRCEPSLLSPQQYFDLLVALDGADDLRNLLSVLVVFPDDHVDALR